MAAVTEYKRGVQLRAKNQTGVSVSTSANTFGASVGAATRDLGDAGFKVADAIDFKQQLEAGAKGREAFNAYRYDQREAMRSPDGGFLTRTGGNAAGTQQAAEDRLGSLRDQYGEGLDPRARKEFDGLVDGLQDQAHGQLLNHNADQSRNYSVNQAQSTIAGYVEEAATNWNDEALFDENVGLALGEMSRLGALQGADPASMRAEAEQLISGAFRSRIVQAAAADPIAAKELLDNSRDMLSAEDEYALDNSLDGLVIEAQANEFTQGYIVRGGATADGVADPYAAALGGAESGNNPFAANNPNNAGFASADGRYSSALGPHQYLRGTYREAVAQMRDAGLAPWAEGLTDNELQLTRTDVAKEGEVHNFVRAGNQEQLRAQGFEVTPTSEYAFHHFGDAGGAGLLRAIRDNPAGSAASAFGVSTAGILKANPQFANKTAGEIYDWISNHLGADGATASGQPYFNAQQAYADAMLVEDPELRAAIILEVNTMATLQDNARGAGRQEAQQEAWRQYNETGRTDFPMEMRTTMGQAGWGAFRQATRSDQLNPTVTDPDTWEELTRAASSDPQGFADMNLAARYGNLSTSDRQHFITVQEATRRTIETNDRDAATARTLIDYEAVNKTADEVYSSFVEQKTPSQMNLEQRQQRLRFQQRMAEMTREFYDREGREPTSIDVREMATALALRVTPSDAGMVSTGSGEFLFQMADRPDDVSFSVAAEYGDIPFAERSRIAAALEANGVTAEQGDIVNAYEVFTMMQAGLPPVIADEQVPSAFVATARARRVGISDADITENYVAYLLADPMRAMDSLAEAAPEVLSQGAERPTPETPNSPDYGTSKYDELGPILQAPDAPEVPAPSVNDPDALAEGAEARVDDDMRDAVKLATDILDGDEGTSRGRQAYRQMLGDAVEMTPLAQQTALRELHRDLSATKHTTFRDTMLRRIEALFTDG
ncbi:lysozyme [Octadecabacter Antarctic BD virus 1]|nr:lysozyme [Octadecabacter Antarctic BD virus 1]